MNVAMAAMGRRPVLMGALERLASTAMPSSAGEAYDTTYTPSAGHSHTSYSGSELARAVRR